MDYKEAYYSLIERLKEAKEDANICDERYCCVIDGLIKEPEENEDEQHRKWILEYLYDGLRKSDEQFKGQFKCAIAWLEKQAKYKSPEEVLKIRQELYQSGYNDGYKHGCEDTKKKGANPQGKSALEAIHEQNPDNANKVERKFKVGDVMRTLQEAADNITSGLPVFVSIDEEYYHCTNELIAIKDQDDYEFPSMNRKQKPVDSYCQENCKGFQETGKCFADGDCDAKIKAGQKTVWGEDDEDEFQIVQKIICDSDTSSTLANRLSKWHQSLKERAIWKPSKEQIVALRWVLNNIPYNKHKEEISGLLDQIKDL